MQKYPSILVEIWKRDQNKAAIGFYDGADFFPHPAFTSCTPGTSTNPHPDFSAELSLSPEAFTWMSEEWITAQGAMK